MKVIIEYFWDYGNKFHTKIINYNSEINDIKDIPDVIFEKRTYKPIFINENTMDKEIKTIFVYCKNEDDTSESEKKNYKNKLVFYRSYDNIYLIPTIFRKLNIQCIKTKLPFDNYNVSNNFEVEFEIVNSKKEEYKMIKYILLRLLYSDGFSHIEIKDEEEEKEKYSSILERIASIDFIV